MAVRIVKDYSGNGPAISLEYRPDPADRPKRQRRPSKPRPQRVGERAAPNHDARFSVGLDLGQANDYGAMAVCNAVANSEVLEVPFLARTRGKPYPALVANVESLMDAEPFAGNAQLVIDATGVGRPVLDMFRTGSLNPVAVTITAGQRVTGARYRFGVPKRYLITGLLLAFQNGRLRIAADLPLASVLVEELTAMRVRITAAGNDQYGAWREGEHDDLVLALAIAVWWADRAAGRRTALPPPEPEPKPIPPRRHRLSNHELMDLIAPDDR